MAYNKYLTSPEWYATRDRRLRAADFRCEFELDGKRCNATQNLNVHHHSYARLGAELDADLEVLCRPHHLVRHMMDAECEVCGAQLVDDVEEALETISKYQIENNGDLPSLRELGLKQTSRDDVLLCWFCEEKLEG